jgi:hypothetical protein
MIVAIVFLGGCATSNHDSASTSAPAPAQVASVTPATSGANAKDPRVIATARYANENGYHKETRRSGVFWCRSVAPIGSLLEKNECMTDASLFQAEQRAEMEKANLENSHICQGATCTFH